MTIAANVYCTADDIRDVLSAAGVTLSSDDSPPSTLGNAIAKAGNRIDLYLARFYEPADLAQSDLVKDWAATIAAYVLRTRRGNPAPESLQFALETVLGDLEEIKKGQNDIPGIARRKSYAPGLSVMRATQRPYPRAVVERSRGTTAGGSPAGYRQWTDGYDAYGWNAHAFLDLTL